MKKSDLVFTSILPPLDYLMIILAGLSVYFLRFQTLAALRPVIFELNFFKYFKVILLIGLLWLPIFALNGLYRVGRQRFSQEFVRIFSAVTVGTMLIVLVIFFRRELFSSRFIVLAGWVAAIAFVGLGRIIVHFIYLLTFNRGLGLESVLILGRGNLVDNLIQSMNGRGFGYRVVGNPESVEEIIRQWSDKTREIDLIIQADPSLPKEDIMELVGFCSEHQIIFKYVADSFGALLANIKIETLAGLPIIEIKQTALDGWGRIIKRIFDLVLSLLGLLILWPFFCLIAVIIKIDSDGPIFVTLKRVGQRGKIFKLYKFRSMVKNAQQMKTQLMQYSERQGPLFKMQNDPRITRTGRFLRKWSLDELPQLFNVLKGEMSLVGPRPHEPEEVSQYKRSQKQLLTIKPGMTGLAQVSGRSDLPFDEEAELDIYYMEYWSLASDLQILIKTIPVVLGRKNVA